MATGRLEGLYVSARINHGGRYQLSGVVQELGVPGPYRVRLFVRNTGALVAQLWSDKDGAWLIQNLEYKPRGYTVIAYDHGDNPLNAVVYDLFTPVLMS